MSSSGWCTVQGCPGRPHDAYFRFPLDKLIYEKWLKVCKSPKSKKPIPWAISSRVCSLHFTDEDYETADDLAGNLTLKCPKPTAIPSIFPWTDSWSLNKKKKKAGEGVNEEKPLEGRKKADTTASKETFSCTSCDFSTDNVRSWKNHRRNHVEAHQHWCDECNYSTDSLEQLEIHFSRDHDGSSTDGSASPVLKKRTGASPGARKTAGRASSCEKALKEKKSRQKESSSSGTATRSVLSESDGSSSSNISESTSDTGSSSSDSGIHKSASSLASETPPDDAVRISASPNGMGLSRSISVKRKVDSTLIVLDSSSSSDDEKEDEVMEMSETVIKKEIEAGEAKMRERKIIWVVSGKADE